MEDSGIEINKLHEANQKSPPDKEKLYIDVIHNEARSALKKYLPRAVPQEPTEILIGDIPQYVGKFRDKHYIILEKDPELVPIIQLLQKHVQEMEWLSEKFKMKDELEKERSRLIDERIKIDDLNFDEINERIDHEQDLIMEMPMPERKVSPEPKDYENPEKLLGGPKEFSSYSWRQVYSLVHELIHQKQAELNPSAFPTLTPPQLNDIDPDSMVRSELYSVLKESHKADTRTKNKNSLFNPVVEGMATLGAFYVMKGFAEELEKSGEKDAADKIDKIRKTMIHEEIIDSKRNLRKTGKTDNYNLNYAEGLGIIKKLYKKIGLENLQNTLESVDLKACENIIKGTHQYEDIVRDPTLLPGLKAA